MRTQANPTEKFHGWFVRAIEKLKELPEGDGAFAALMVAFPLYERYIRAKLKIAGDSDVTDDEISAEMNIDLGVTDAQRKIFWAVYRIGFLHQAMGKTGGTKWIVSDHFGPLPEFRTINGHRCVCIDPWKFTDRVLSKFVGDPRLITASESFPWADVFEVYESGD